MTLSPPRRPRTPLRRPGLIRFQLTVTAMMTPRLRKTHHSPRCCFRFRLPRCHLHPPRCHLQPPRRRLKLPRRYLQLPRRRQRQPRHSLRVTATRSHQFHPALTAMQLQPEPHHLQRQLPRSSPASIQLLMTASLRREAPMQRQEAIRATATAARPNLQRMTAAARRLVRMTAAHPA